MSEGRRAVGSVEVNGIRTGRAVRGQARGGCALRVVVEFCLALAREPTVARAVNSFLIADWSSTEIAVGFGVGSRGHDDIGASVPVCFIPDANAHEPIPGCAGENRPVAKLGPFLYSTRSGIGIVHREGLGSGVGLQYELDAR